MFFTYEKEVEDVRKKVDSVPYESFPYCCSMNNSSKTDIDINKVPI